MLPPNLKAHAEDPNQDIIGCLTFTLVYSEVVAAAHIKADLTIWEGIFPTFRLDQRSPTIPIQICQISLGVFRFQATVVHPNILPTAVALVWITPNMK
jgi:hypothetical protein